MERSDLLEANGGIFKPQGKALNEHAASDIKVLVVGNPANTNCLIAQSNAPDIPRERFTAMTRLDHNRAIAQLAEQDRRAGQRRHEHDDLGQPLGHAVPRHLPRQGRAARTRPRSSTTRPGSRTTFIPTVQKRGAAIIEARGASSAASAANAAIDHVHDWVLGTPAGDWVSMAIPSDGSYGVEEGVISGFPVHVRRTASTRSSQGLEINEFSRARIDATVNELKEERDAGQAARPDLSCSSAGRS